jgi:large subunit ribosomal protein L23
MVLEKIKSTEKLVRMIEAENVIVFEVDRKVTKEQVKNEIESLFSVKVGKVRTHTRKNKKLAYIKLKEGQAIDIATKLGVM